MAKMEPVEPGSLSARTYWRLRESLIAGTFAPGERMLMADLAERLGTSVTPVREACFRLVSEQALELKSGRFISVPELTRSRYWQIRLIRISLEGLAAQLAVDHVTDKEIDRLEKVHRRFVKSETSGDAENARIANREFHFGVYNLSGMDMLIAQIENLWVSMGPILNVYYQWSDNDYVGADEHLNLLEDLRRRDGKGARDAIERDIVRGGMNLIKYFDAQKEKAVKTDAA